MSMLVFLVLLLMLWQPLLQFDKFHSVFEHDKLSAAAMADCCAVGVLLSCSCFVCHGLHRTLLVLFMLLLLVLPVAVHVTVEFAADVKVDNYCCLLLLLV